MARIFNQHKIRECIQLPEVWNFSAKGKKISRMPVPCCIETNPELINYKGEVKYETEFTGSGNIRLAFSGVSHTAFVSLNGEALGSHYGAYGEFDFICTNLEEKSHKLSLTVNNAFGKEASINFPNDYYTYGGITRPVVIQKLKDVYIKQVHFTPFLENGTWKSKTEVLVENISEQEQEIKIALSLCEVADSTNVDQMAIKQGDSEKKIVLQGGEKREICFVHDYEQVKEYSHEHPALYYLTTLLFVGSGNDEEKNMVCIDDYIDRVGFKHMEIKGSDILMNGEKLIIKGFNRHEDYGDFGCAIPLSAMYRDLQLVINSGANCVRTSHYPNDERFLDLCDENGILVWEEGHARGMSEELMSNPLFIDQEKLTLREMMEQHYNHPSIFVWGLLNECCDFTELGKDCYTKLVAYMRTMDQSRPISYAACHYGKAASFDLVDIVSLNMYPGWYTDSSTAEFLEEGTKWAEENGGLGKPILISEIGAGAVYGYRDARHAKWTEERQEELLTEQLQTIFEKERYSGAIIWQFADCRVDEEWFANRPKSENNKGIVDKYRREKLAYSKVSEIFHSV
ncbi:beta-glucuronidase [Lachnospiraceae bacterium OttesenSCG-928-D06]|nr:beta-glucuronidase [Lachnospiraceae bacterium OttesenSCG-928-D06]